MKARLILSKVFSQKLHCVSCDVLRGAVDAWGNDSLGLEGRNAPFHAMGTYYGIVMSTFEPTMGITESQTLFMSSYVNGPGGSTAVVA